jgi:hypothetical protein
MPARLIPLLLLAWGLAGHGGAAAESGYLPVTGPAGLRFAPPRPAPKNPGESLALPPLAKVDRSSPAAGATNEAAAIRATAPPPASAPGAVGRTEAAAGATNRSPANPSGVAPTPELDPTVSPVDPTESAAAPPHLGFQAVMPQPQLFLQYFTPEYTPGSNGYGIFLPVGFVPPQPRSAGSSATYQVVTPDKK